MDFYDARDLRWECGRFRALIVGRANAGKTTILKAICNSTEEPRIYDRDGKEICPDVIAPSMERGEHDISDELRFSSSGGFVFHDSRGFESGSTAEVESMKRFIEERADARSLHQKLHAIWYCIPTDNARLLTAAEVEFFDNCDPKGVPVIVIFTKFDSLDAIAFTRLEEEGASFEEAEAQAPQLAEQEFNKEQLPRISGRKYPPAKIVYLRDMHENGKYEKIIELTTESLSSETLKMLLVSVQKTNLNMCISGALKSWEVKQQMKECARMKKIGKTMRKQLRSILGWFPHTLAEGYEYNYGRDNYEYNEGYEYNYGRDNYRVDHSTMQFYQSTLVLSASTLNGSLPPFLLHLNQYLVIVICLHHSFWTIQKSERRFTSKIFDQSLQHYVNSGTAEVVRSAILETFKDDVASMSQVLSSDEGYNQVIDSLLQITHDNLMTHE